MDHIRMAIGQLYFNVVLSAIIFLGSIIIGLFLIMPLILPALILTALFGPEKF